MSQISNHFSHRSFTKNLQGWYEGLVAHTPPGDKYFLRPVLPIISLGVHYSSFTGSVTQDIRSLQQLYEKILPQTEYSFCERGSSIMCADVDQSLQRSIHCWTGNSRSCIKIAHVIGLHRETMWQGLSDVGREPSSSFQ